MRLLPNCILLSFFGMGGGKNQYYFIIKQHYQFDVWCTARLYCVKSQYCNCNDMARRKKKSPIQRMRHYQDGVQYARISESYLIRYIQYWQRDYGECTSVFFFYARFYSAFAMRVYCVHQRKDENVISFLGRYCIR